MGDFIKHLPPLPLAAEMRTWDRNAIEFGIPETMLMENAGRALCQFALARYPQVIGQSVWLFMGGGNNGGDAACMARHLLDAGARPLIWHTRPLINLSGASAWHAHLAQADNVQFITLDEGSLARLSIQAFEAPPALLVDGLLGTGFQGPLRDNLVSIINSINRLATLLRAPMLAIDCPSGLDSDTGRPLPVAVKADCTVTLAAAKPGLALSAFCTGELFVRKIGFPAALARKNPSSWRLLDGHCLLHGPTLPANGHKNLFGHVYVIGGTPDLSGAPHVACVAALRAGAGLVTACASGNALPIIKGDRPEIMTMPLETGLNEIYEMAWKDKASVSCVIGPGMGRDARALNILSDFLDLPSRPPTVFDADALYLLANNPGLLAKTGPADILTPHPGEAGAFLGISGRELQNDRVGALNGLIALTRACVILKGANTIVGQNGGPCNLLCPYDIPQLSIGGSGDALAGCVGALLARNHGESALAIAGKGAALHVLAGLLGKNLYPERGLLTSEVCDLISHVAARLASLPCPEGLTPWPQSF